MVPYVIFVWLVFQIQPYVKMNAVINIPVSFCVAIYNFTGAYIYCVWPTWYIYNFVHAHYLNRLDILREEVMSTLEPFKNWSPHCPPYSHTED